jgi:hypothetical protein
MKGVQTAHQQRKKPSMTLRAEKSPVILRFTAITLRHENKTVTAMTGSG